VIDIPLAEAVEEVYEAEEQPARPFDDDEFEVEPPPELPAQNDRKPCPMCGELIQRNAIKCRFCGEVFDPVLRAKEQKSVVAADADLTTIDYLLAILCSNIGCIVSIVYAIQGKPKWTKMLLVSLIAQFAWAAIFGILQALTQQ